MGSSRKLYVIDNKELDRATNLSNIIKIFSDSITNLDYEVVSDQTDEFNISNRLKFKVVLRRSILMFQYGHRRRKALKLNLAQTTIDGVKDLVRIFLNVINTQIMYEKIKKEMYLSQKHIYCWRNQIQNKISFSIISENDLCLMGNDNQSLDKLLVDIDSIDLCVFSHSVEVKHLMLDNIIKEISQNSIVYRKIISNGTSGYTISLSLCKHFIEILSKFPELNLLTPDFLIFALGLEIDKYLQKDIETKFIYPSDFIHLSGSKFKSELEN
jgi:hypothetical protein